VVPHHGTNWAALWLTAQIRRDAVLSESYGRGCQRDASTHIYADYKQPKKNAVSKAYVLTLLIQKARELRHPKEGHFVNLS
jgi:hypothetical protein